MLPEVGLSHSTLFMGNIVFREKPEVMAPALEESLIRTQLTMTHHRKWWHFGKYPLTHEVIFSYDVLRLIRRHKTYLSRQLCASTRPLLDNFCATTRHFTLRGEGKLISTRLKNIFESCTDELPVSKYPLLPLATLITPRGDLSTPCSVIDYYTISVSLLLLRGPIRVIWKHR